MALKPGDQQSNRPLLRLPQVIQKALQKFVGKNLFCGWNELSDAPWVSYIFGIPKKDICTRKYVYRLLWIRSGNANILLRWVIHFRYVNSQSFVLKILYPRIDALFDRMQGMIYVTVIELSQGYHEMRFHSKSKMYTAFRTSNETYPWCVALIGLAGMPGIW